MVKDFIIGTKINIFMVYFKMVKKFKELYMEKFSIEVSLKAINVMALVNASIQTGLCILVNGKMEKEMDKELLYNLLAINSQEIGEMEKNMVKDFIKLKN